MSNNKNNKNNSILGNILKGVVTLILTAIAGGLSGLAHSNINENKRRDKADKIERAYNTERRGE